MHNIHSPSSSIIFGRNTLPPLTTNSMNLLRQQMDESYQALTTQMGRLEDFFAPPQAVYQSVPQVQNQQPLQLVEPMVQRP
jgi:hypothetical protein